jgi:hypothetical protein
MPVAVLWPLTLLGLVVALVEVPAGPGGRTAVRRRGGGEPEKIVEGPSLCVRGACVGLQVLPQERVDRRALLQSAKPGKLQQPVVHGDDEIRQQGASVVRIPWSTRYQVHAERILSRPPAVCG